LLEKSKSRRPSKSARRRLRKPKPRSESRPRSKKTGLSVAARPKRLKLLVKAELLKPHPPLLLLRRPQLLQSPDQRQTIQRRS
jgi:hypothetical protein